jgi:hypothetical protein
MELNISAERLGEILATMRSARHSEDHNIYDELESAASDLADAVVNAYCKGLNHAAAVLADGNDPHEDFLRPPADLDQEFHHQWISDYWRGVAAAEKAHYTD